MALQKNQIELIENTIKNSLRKRFATYNPEPAYMPFHTRLLGKDRLVLYKFIHSLNTNFGTTIFEPVAVTLASSNYKIVKKQEKVGTQISTAALFEIQKIMDDLTSASKSPNKNEEIERLRKVCREGELRTVKPTIADVFIEGNNNELYLIDIKTAKPNKDGFKEFKRTLLEWTAIKLAENQNIEINTLIAIPYNPYSPKPYSRWTMAGMLDLETELKVAEEFWDFLGGEGTYEIL